jgi:hypothetical protein
VKPASRVQVAWQIDLPSGIDLPLGSVLEDVGPNETMLLRNGHRLILWRAGTLKPSAEVQLPAWPQYEKGPPDGAVGDTICKFSVAGNLVVCAHGPWIALLDLGTKKEVRRITGAWTQDFSEFNWNTVGVVLSQNVPLLMPSSPVVLGVDPKNGHVAVAYNTLKNPEISVFSADLRTRIASWRSSKYLQSLFWSRDAKRLGALYFTENDKPANRQWKWTGWHPAVMPGDVPNVSVFDASSGKELLNFATSGIDAKVTFSPDGELIYAITSFGTIAGYWRGGTSDTLRAFSSATGKLVRTFKVRETGVRNNFAVSPDGRFIAAESSKATHSDMYYLLRLKENLGGSLDAGFVILDASTGRVIFREKRTIFGDLAGVLPLFFSAKGDLLITEFGQPPNRLVAYSIGH